MSAPGVGAAFAGPGKVWDVIRKGPQGWQAASPRRADQPHHRVASGRSERWRNHRHLRARVGHPFRVIKRQFGHVKTRYRGLARNRAQLFTLFALGNLFLVRRKLMA